MSLIRIDTSSVNRAINGLKGVEKQMPAAFVSAVNRTLDHVYSRTGKIVTKHYNVTAKEIKESMVKHKANYSRLHAYIRVRSKRFTIARFLPGGLGSTSRVAKVKIKKAAGRKQIGGNPKPFVVHNLKGNTHVLRRLGKERYPVEVVRTLSPTQMVENLDVMNEVKESAVAMLEKRLQHEVSRRLRKVTSK